MPAEFLNMEKIKSIELDDILGKPFTFTRRPDLLPCEMRPLWRCSLILLIIQYTGRSNTCSLKKMHVINWALKTEKNTADFQFWVFNPAGIKPEIRLDPTLDRALELLISDGLMSKIGDRFTVTDKGKEITKRIELVNSFEKEKTLLSKLKKSLTEANISKIFQVR